MARTTGPVCNPSSLPVFSLCTTHLTGLELLIQSTFSLIIKFPLSPLLPPQPWGLTASCARPLFRRHCHCWASLHYAHHRPAFSQLSVPGRTPALWGHSELVQSHFSMTSLQLFKSSSWYPKSHFFSCLSTPSSFIVPHKSSVMFFMSLWL